MNNCYHCNKPTNNPKYCSKSCAAKINNTISPKRSPSKRTCCLYCKQETSNPKFCSNSCQSKHRTHTKFKQIEAGVATPTKNYLLYLYGHYCQICQNTTWNKQPIPIELDHIDGDSTNNMLENLRLICPNCHAQTDTYKSRNRGNGRYYRRERYANGQSF